MLMCGNAEAACYSTTFQFLKNILLSGNGCHNSNGLREANEQHMKAKPNGWIQHMYLD